MFGWSLRSLPCHDRHKRFWLLFILIVTISHYFAKYNFLVRFRWDWICSRRWAVIGRLIWRGGLLHLEHFLYTSFLCFEDLRRWWSYGLFLLSFLFLRFVLVLITFLFSFILLRMNANIIFTLFTKVIRIFFSFWDFGCNIVHLKNLTSLLLSIKIWRENDTDFRSATAPLLYAFALYHWHVAHLCLWLRKDLSWVSFIINTVIVMYNKYLLSRAFLYLKIVFGAWLVGRQTRWSCGRWHSNLFIYGTLTIVYGGWRCA